MCESFAYMWRCFVLALFGCTPTYGSQSRPPEFVHHPVPACHSRPPCPTCCCRFISRSDPLPLAARRHARCPALVPAGTSPGAPSSTDCPEQDAVWCRAGPGNAGILVPLHL